MGFSAAGGEQVVVEAEAIAAVLQPFDAVISGVEIRVFIAEGTEDEPGLDVAVDGEFSLRRIGGAGRGDGGTCGEQEDAQTEVGMERDH